MNPNGQPRAISGGKEKNNRNTDPERTTDGVWIHLGPGWMTVKEMIDGRPWDEDRIDTIEINVKPLIFLRMILF